MNARSHHLTTIFGLLTLGMCFLPAWAAAAGTPAEAPCIHNSAQPAQGLESVRLEELWRRGGEDDEVLFGVIVQVQIDEDGNLYLLDGQLSQVEVFSPAGEHLGTLSREGEGPGETRRPGDLVLMPDGNLGLAQNFPGKLVLIDQQGNPAGQIEIGHADPSQGGFSILRRVVCSGGNLVMGASTTRQGDGGQGTQIRTPVIARYTPDGAQEMVYYQDEYTFDFTSGTFTFDEARNLEIPLRRFAVGPDGRVYVAPDRERYAIEVFEPDGTLVHTIERDYEIQKRSRDEVDFWRKLYEASLRGVPLELDLKMCETLAPIDWIFGGLTVREDGTLWVRTSRGSRDQPDGVMLTYDVFDHEGRFQKQVAVQCPGRAREDALFFAGPDRMILVKGFMDAVVAMIGGGVTDEEADEEPAPMEVICYAVR
jgi:hypothetical protein